MPIDGSKGSPSIALWFCLGSERQQLETASTRRLSCDAASSVEAGRRFLQCNNWVDLLSIVKHTSMTGWIDWVVGDIAVE